MGAPSGLVVLSPMHVEARAVRRGLVDAEVVVTGVGPARSQRRIAGADDVAVRARAASAIAVAGFAGALDRDLQPGDVVVADHVVGPDGDTIELPSARLLGEELRRAGVRVRVGGIVSAPSIVRGPARHDMAATGALAVDMESYWLAATAASRRQPVAVVRAIVDTPDRELWSSSTPAGALRAARALRRAAPVLETWAAAAAMARREVWLAGPRSFCAGVERAIDIVGRCIDRFGAPVYVRRQIVHNRHVVAGLERRGAVFVEELDDVPDGALVVFAAHGVAPAVRAEADERRLRVVDATCPLVAKVHSETRRFARQGYDIILIGHVEHEEIEGTVGEAELEPSADVRVVATVADASVVDVGDPHRVAYLTQTTLAVDEVADIVSELRSRFPAIVGPKTEDICYASQNRQEAVRELAQGSDLVLVVGSSNSSNSNRLVEVALRHGCDAHLIDDESGLRLAWLAHARVITITAGASAPEEMVQRVIAALATLGSLRITQRQVVTESVRFSLPAEVR